MAIFTIATMVSFCGHEGEYTGETKERLVAPRSSIHTVVETMYGNGESISSCLSSKRPLSRPRYQENGVSTRAWDGDGTSELDSLLRK